jgi:hypothetical protein
MALKRYFRNAVLAIMFISAAATTCISESYDPDPYDDIPPVVSLEFHYLVPERASVQVQQALSWSKLVILGSAQYRNHAHAAATTPFAPQFLLEPSSNSFQATMALRC